MSDSDRKSQSSSSRSSSRSRNSSSRSRSSSRSESINRHRKSTSRSSSRESDSGVERTAKKVSDKSFSKPTSAKKSRRILDSSSSIPKPVKDYLVKHEKEKILNKNKPFSLKDIDSDDEVFIIQCSRSIDVKTLQNKFLSLDSDRPTKIKDDKASLEVVVDQSQKSESMTIICGDGNIPKLVTIQPKGRITLRNRIKMSITPSKTNTDRDDQPKSVPFPKHLKVRHPLLGDKFEDRLVLPKNVIAKLKEANNFVATNVKTERKSRGTKVQLEEDSGDEVFEKKMTKKRKREAELDMTIEEEEIIKSPRMKKIKKEKPETIDSNGQEWLALEERDEEISKSARKTKIKKEKPEPLHERAKEVIKSARKTKIKKEKMESTDSGVSNDLEWLTQI